MEQKTGQQKRIDDNKVLYVLFGLCWSVYFVSYLGRLNYSVAMVPLIQEQFLTHAQAGTISMAFFLCYGSGQIIFGILADRLKPHLLLFVGLVAGGTFNCLMGFSRLAALFTVCWGLNGLAQAMIWPALFRIFADYLTARVRLKFIVHMASSMALGTFVSYLLSSYLISRFTWRYIFQVPAVLFFLIAVTWLLLFNRVKRFADVYGVEEDEKIATRPVSGTTPRRRAILGGGFLILVIPVMINGFLKDGVTVWTPTFLSESFQIRPEMISLVMIILPIVNLSGTYAADAVFRRLKTENRSTAVFFFVAAAAIALLQIGLRQSVILSALLLAVVTSSMIAINTLLINFFPLRFRLQGLAATVSGTLNAIAYLGSAVCTFTIGLLVESKGWSFTIGLWLILTIKAALLCLLPQKMMKPAPDS